MIARKLKLCFVVPNGYPVLAGDRKINVVGGAEVQQAFIASELARRGHEVSMICMDYGQPDGGAVNGVTVLNMHEPDVGIPVLRFVYPRLTSLWAALRRADAEIYYQRAAGFVTGIVAHFTRRNGRRSMYAAAHDLNFDPLLPQLRFARDRFLFRYGIRNVDQIVVQSERQLEACREVYGRSSVMIRSCYEHKGNPARPDGPIVWVGTTKPIKRPELFLNLAEGMPQYKFILVGGAKRGTPRFDALLSRARSAGNVEMIGTVPYAEVEQYFDGASLLVSTSEGEGFPNTLLQAWSRGIPTISFFRDQATIAGQDVSTIVDDVASMNKAVTTLKVSKLIWNEKSAIAKEYFTKNHTVSAIVDEYEREFASLLRRQCRQSDDL